jgi:hypothetical protein
MSFVYPNGPEYGVPYVLTGPDGSRAVFNDQTDADYVGALTDATGFDSPEVRESADNLVGMDGGIHGSFYYGRRPVTLSGTVYNVATDAVRNTRLTKLQQASNAVRGDATLSWTPGGGVAQQIKVRRQQPLRISGGWVKDFQLSLVAADPRIYSAVLHTQSVAASGTPTPSGRGYAKAYPVVYGGGSILGQMFVVNSGSALSYPILTFTGPGSNPSALNLTTGERISLIYTLGAGDTLTVDTLNRTVVLNGTASRYSAIDFTNTAWWGLVPGSNDVRLSWGAYTAGASLTVQYRDAWL